MDFPKRSLIIWLSSYGPVCAIMLRIASSLAASLLALSSVSDLDRFFSLTAQFRHIWIWSSSQTREWDAYFVCITSTAFLLKSKGMVPFLSVADSAFSAAKILVKSTLQLTENRPTNSSEYFWNKELALNYSDDDKESDCLCKKYLARVHIMPCWY